MVENTYLEQEKPNTFILDTYRSGKLFSGQASTNRQESLNRAAHGSDEEDIEIMISPEGEVIIHDGHHRTATKILEGKSPSYKEIPYRTNVSKWPFDIFLREIKKQYPPGYWLYK